MNSIDHRRRRSTWMKAITLSLLWGVTCLGCGGAEDNPKELMKKSAAVRIVPKGKWDCIKVAPTEAIGDHFALSEIDFAEKSIVLEEQGVPHRLNAKWNFKTTPTSVRLTSSDNSLNRFAILAKTRSGRLRVALREGKWPVDFQDPSAVQLTLGAANNFKPVVIFMVHGCFDGASDWDREIPDHVTFASELRSAFGEVECQIVPRPWSGTLEHRDRILAAESLAGMIDAPEYSGHRIFIVAHSHGGNIALAACGRIQRKVDAVVCLATPHVHLTMRKNDNRPVLLPVYLSLKARKKIGRLLCMMPQCDSVVNTFANLVAGVTTQEALNETIAWQKIADHPRFQQGHKLHFELLRRLLGIEHEHDLIMTGTLTAADHNLAISSEVGGIESHTVIHSRRVGRLLGGWFRATDRAAAANYLERLVLPVDADNGCSVSPAFHQAWLSRNQESVKACGWILTKAEVTDVTNKGRRSNNRIDFWDLQEMEKFGPPDIFLSAEEAGVERRITDTSDDCFAASFSPFSHLGHSKRFTCRVIDSDTDKASALGKTVNNFVRDYVTRPIAPVLDDLMGAIEIDLPDADSEEAPAREFDHSNFRLKLEWQRGHY